MKKKMTLLALAFTLCGTFAAFPVNTHATSVSFPDSRQPAVRMYSGKAVSVKLNKSFEEPKFVVDLSVSDNALDSRYGKDCSESIMRVNMPFLQLENRNISINFDNSKVISVLGDNVCEKIYCSSIPKTYVYNIGENNTVLSRGS